MSSTQLTSLSDGPPGAAGVNHRARGAVVATLALLLMAEVPSDAQVRSAHVEATVTVVRPVYSRAAATPDTVVARPESPIPAIVAVKREETPGEGASLHVYVWLVN